jgi:cytochrome oxidase Cu insertion factor (SCO1/SenC/PrrC family)
VKRPPPAPPAVVLRRRAQVVLIALLFLGPLALSFWAYYGLAYRPPGRTNHGELIEPARPLPDAILATGPGASTTTAALLRGHWSLVTIAAGACERACRDALAASGTARLALGGDLRRVQRVLLIAAPCCAPGIAPDPELGAGWLAGTDGQRLAAEFPGGASGDRAGWVYVVDPHGNLLMRYPPGEAGQGMLRDLEQLLTRSHIG